MIVVIYAYHSARISCWECTTKEQVTSILVLHLKVPGIYIRSRKDRSHVSTWHKIWCKDQSHVAHISATFSANRISSAYRGRADNITEKESITYRLRYPPNTNNKMTRTNYFLSTHTNNQTTYQPRTHQIAQNTTTYQPRFGPVQGIHNRTLTAHPQYTVYLARSRSVWNSEVAFLIWRWCQRWRHGNHFLPSFVHFRRLAQLAREGLTRTFHSRSDKVCSRFIESSSRTCHFLQVTVNAELRVVATQEPGVYTETSHWSDSANYEYVSTPGLVVIRFPLSSWRRGSL